MTRAVQTKKQRPFLLQLQNEREELKQQSSDFSSPPAQLLHLKDFLDIQKKNPYDYLFLLFYSMSFSKTSRSHTLVLNNLCNP